MPETVVGSKRSEDSAKQPLSRNFMLKVYGYEDSPYVMRVEWILKELNIAYEFVRVDLLSNEQNTNWYLNISPIGQVPAIEADGGVRVFDSLAIIKYVAL